MSQDVSAKRRGRRWGQWLVRLLGIGLLIVLLGQLDRQQVWVVVRSAQPGPLILATLGMLPLIWLKTLRWQIILSAQDADMPIWRAFLAYFGSLFIGYLTPGRLGEFVKALHVHRDTGISTARAFSTVLTDRLFDLYLLMIVGGAALTRIVHGALSFVGLVLLVLGLTAPLAILLSEGGFGWLRSASARFGRIGARLFADDGPITEIRAGLVELHTPAVLLASVLTILAYLLFYGQCYLIVLALDLPIGYVPIMFAAGLGSLVTLLPVSIAGLGTREAAIIFYLSTYGVVSEEAIGFSLLMFTVFYIAGGLIGAIAWMLHPAPLAELKARRDATASHPS